LFYNGHYESAAALTRTLPPDEAEDLAIYELRSSAVLFQLRRAIGDAEDKDKAFKQCAACPDLMSSFLDDFHAGQQAARTILRTSPKDERALFFLGKLDLNYVWLVLGTLGRRTGWNEYWEARRSLDTVLANNRQHIRARVARAWIDYIVDTRIPWGTKWMFGGGNRKRALADMRQLAGMEGDFFTSAEAGFGLWDMLVREKKYEEAVAIATRLAALFPRNAELARFIEVHRTR
jgi:hypothetical protein